MESVSQIKVQIWRSLVNIHHSDVTMASFPAFGAED